ncbi:MAG TPA: PaaI family thioesterase [Phycisphaerae bacterium]|nr:PaaI family thioesterase [Phycisphaerae bacterium]
MSELPPVVSPERRDAILRRIEPIPVVRAMQMRIDELRDGYCRATVPRDRRYDGIYNSYHGGLLATVADSIACFAIMTLTGPEQHLTTTDLNIRYLAACRSDVTAEARVIKLGRTLVPVEVKLFDEHRVHVAVAHVTYFRLSDAPPKG